MVPRAESKLQLKPAVGALLLLQLLLLAVCAHLCLSACACVFVCVQI